MWGRLAALVAVFVGCASASPESPPVEEKTEEDTRVVVDSAPVDTRPEETARDPAANCPACEATKCRTELDACARSSACVNWLLCMNECFRAPGTAACQEKCTKDNPSPQASAMAACKKTNCADACEPN